MILMSHPDPLELMILQEQSYFTHDQNGRILLADEPWDGTRPGPRFYLGRTIDGKIIRKYRHDLPDKIVDELERVSRDEIAALEFDDYPKNRDEYLKILETTDFNAGPCWLVPPAPEPSETATVLVTRNNIRDFSVQGFEWLLDEIDVAEPCAGIIVEGRLVSQCRSIRRSPGSHEAGLETLPEFRGRGFAGIVTLAWARAVRDLRALPIYSTSWTNSNSRQVAKKLRLYHYGNIFSVK
jgi:hypothetical protein